jgi:hypothetical protein
MEYMLLHRAGCTQKDDQLLREGSQWHAAGCPTFRGLVRGSWDASGPGLDISYPPKKKLLRKGEDYKSSRFRRLFL